MNVAFNGIVSGSRAGIAMGIEQLSENIMARDTRSGTILAAEIEDQG
jgi:hypothetical protein